MSKKSILLAFYIGQIFIWTGSAFMTVLYHLYDIYTETQVTLVAEVLYYVMQSVGILLYAYAHSRKRENASSSLFATCALAIAGIVTTITLFSTPGFSMLMLGCIMNIGIGFVSGFYFTRIASHVPASERGLTFGISYATGSIGTFLLSLLHNGNGLTAPYMPYVYIGMILLSIVLSRFLPGKSDSLEHSNYATDKGLLLLAFVVPFMCYVVYTLGYHFSEIDSSSGVNLAFTRAFYAISLILAGFTIDRSRKIGSILSFLILIFPFMSLALRHVHGTAALLGIMSYLFLGFLSVYRVILFTDIATRSEGLLSMAPFGLMMGSLGTAVGTSVGIYLDKNHVLLTMITAVLFIVCGILFAILFTKMYFNQDLQPKKDLQQFLYDFQVKYGLNANQIEIFKLILSGDSNGKIAEELHLAESTVKYHVKNILKATECGNRKELIALFHDFCK